MQSPLRITFRVPPTPAIRDRIEQHVSKLDTYYDRIIGCHVTIDAPHRHHAHGRHFNVRIELALPRTKLVVTRDPPQRKEREDLYAAIDDAFGDVFRRLAEISRRRHEHAGDPAAVNH